MNSMVRNVLLALATAAALAVSAFGTTATNEWRIAANDSRYIKQDTMKQIEINRLDEQISDLKYRLKREPGNERLQIQLESKERSMRRWGGGD